MDVPKHSGTLVSIRDIPNIHAEEREYLKRLARGLNNTTTVVRFDNAVHAQGSEDPEDKYRYAVLAPSELLKIAQRGLLSDGANRRVTVGVDRLKQGLIAFDCQPLACDP